MTHSKTTMTNLKKLKAEGDIDITKDEETHFTQDTIEEPTISIFTDGSKMAKKDKSITGAGAIIYTEPKIIEIITPMAGDNTINQAELMAINEAAKELLALDTKGQKIRIHTDSETTLSRIQKGRSNSRQLTETIINLRKLQETNKMEIVKVKAHIG